MLNVVGILELAVAGSGSRCECGQAIPSGRCLAVLRSGKPVKLCRTCGNKKIEEALNYLRGEIREYEGLKGRL